MAPFGCYYPITKKGNKMSNIFALDQDVEEVKATDTLGKYTLDGGLYDFRIKQAFLDRAKSGAQCLNLELARRGVDRTNTFQIYFTSKAAPDSFTTEKNGKKFPTYGYNKINDLCLRAIGKKFSEMELVTKKVKVWENRKEVNADRKVFEELIGTDIAIGITEIREDKYDDPAVKVLKNELDKFFDADSKLTTAEIAAEKTEAAFAKTWKEKYEGQVIDKTTKATSVPGAPASGAPSSAPDIFAS